MKLSFENRLVILIFCILKLTLHLIADYNSGFQGDELLHIETGNHIAFGYMEFPPLIGVFAFLQNLFQSESVFIHHIFAHVATILILIFVSKIIIELGGNTKAIFLALLCILIAPGFGRSQQLFQPVVFSQLFWVLSFYQLTRYVKYLNRKYLWYLTFTLVFGFLTKYDIVFFIFGISSLFFFKSSRQALIKHKFWWNISAFIILISPNISWQYLNDFPVLKMFNRLYETQLDNLAPATVFTRLIVSLNPLILLILIPAFVCAFYYRMEKYRPLLVSILLSILLLAYSWGKGYYFYPIVLTILPFGGVFWENVLLAKKKWLFYPIACVLLLGIVLIPFGMPVFSLKSYIENDYRYEKQDVKGGKYAIQFEERYSTTKWKQTLSELKSVYDSLPENERKDCRIWGKHYGQAGAVNLFRKEYNLPESFSLHGSFYNWIPNGDIPNTLIAFRYSKNEGKDFFEPFFEEVIPVISIYDPYADDEGDLWQTIFICKKPKQNFDALKKLFANRVFE